MYQALARKYRPQNFTEVIGQDAVMKTLMNAIALDRLHHAYLFTGARGVGKTSMARILAKSVNCVKGLTVTPCQECPSCVGITKGNAFDVIEIDAASNTGVDNIRELREEVKYLPGAGKYKIYIIDEVHMLSNSAFNALLKTLEEPPAHIMFILATTDPHEIPITILSRCQRFDFRKLSKPVLVNHLRKILTSENVTADDGSVALVAECAQGSVRDALSLLDQVIGYHSQDIQEAQVRAVLGLGDRLLIQETFRDIVTEDLPTSLKNLNAADTQGLELKTFAEALLTYFRHLIILLSTKTVPSEVSPSEKEFFSALVIKSELSLVLAQYQALFQGVQELTYTEFQKTSLEITFVKMAQIREMISLTELVVELKERAEKKNVSGNLAPSSRPQRSESPKTSDAGGLLRHSAPRNDTNNLVEKVSAPASDWYGLVRWIKTVKPQLAGILSDAVPVQYNDQKIEVGFPPTSSSRGLLIERKLLVEDILLQHFGKKIDFVVSELDGEKKKPLSLTEVQNQAAEVFRQEVEKEVGANPVIREMLKEYGVKIKEIKILKETL